MITDRVHNNAKQYMKLLLVWQRILDDPDKPGLLEYDIDRENSIPNLFHQCREVLFSSNDTSLSKTQMIELNNIWRIINK